MRKLSSRIAGLARRGTALVALAALATLSAPVAGAQRPTVTSDSTLCSARVGARPSPVSRDSSRGPVSVVIYAAATAREVRFNAAPQLHVRLCGALDSVHVVDRRNLPSPVVVGTTYQNVYVAVEIFGRLNADCIANELRGGARRGADSSAAGSVTSTTSPCASLELRGASSSARPPSDSSALLRRY